MKKKNKKSQNYNLKNKKNVKTCLYKLNNICGNYHTSYYGYKCGGSLKCDFFKQYSNNNFQYDIKITQNSDIILCIIIPDIQYTSFLSTRNIVSPYITYTSFPDKKRALYVKTINSELLRLIEVGASCFSHQCIGYDITQLNVLHNVHRRISLG